MRNKKSQRMGIIDLDLTEFADADNPVVNKKLKLDIEDGPFELGILRCYLSSKYVPGAAIASAASALLCACVWAWGHAVCALALAWRPLTARCDAQLRPCARPHTQKGRIATTTGQPRMTPTTKSKKAMGRRSRNP